MWLQSFGLLLLMKQCFFDKHIFGNLKKKKVYLTQFPCPLLEFLNMAHALQVLFYDVLISLVWFM